MEHKTAIERVVEFFDGSTTKVAFAIGGKVVRQNVDHWVKTKRVPSDVCPQIELATAGLVRCEDLRPDVAWSVLRNASTMPLTPIHTTPAAAAAQGA
jgi:DNA-binding transcriptional regulator YdaS (Cro superfamily)